MNLAILLPLEPIEERYTEQWYRWFPEEFGRQGWEVKVVDGDRLTESIEVGSFLDLYSSMHWFYVQLSRTVAFLRDVDKTKYKNIVVFAYDVEMWGVEGLRYLKELSGFKNLYITGFLHAASYTTGDFMEPMSFIGKDLEVGWINSFDMVFVGSQYHMYKVFRERPAVITKIEVTGNPVSTKEIHSAIESVIPTDKREYDIIICDRPDYEKRVHEAVMMAVSLIDELNIKIAITTSRPYYRSNKKWISDSIKDIASCYPTNIDLFSGIPKKEYYSIMANSKCYLSATIEENFGYCCVEAMALGTYPVVPNDFAFKEHLSKSHYLNKLAKSPLLSNLLYNTQDGAIEILHDILCRRKIGKFYPTMEEIIYRVDATYDESLNVIVNRIGKLVEKDDTGNNKKV